METYHLKVAGLERDLPVCPLGNGVSIAGFVMFSDVELTIACATELLKKVPDCDVFLTAESKGIPLAYEMSRQSGKRYILARKSKKLYMKNAVEVDVRYQYRRVAARVGDADREGRRHHRRQIGGAGRGRRSQSRRHHFPGAAAAAQN